MKKFLPLVLLILAGELIFALPFHVIRFFRPSLLEDYLYTNMELGVAFSIYGVQAKSSTRRNFEYQLDSFGGGNQENLAENCK